MHPFAVMADPVRRRIVEVLAGGERPAGEIVEAVGGEFGISQSAVSQQLKLLREHGFARVRPEGARRIYALESAAVGAMDGWIRGVSGFWADRLDDLVAEVEPSPAARTRAPGSASDSRLPFIGLASVARTVGHLGDSVIFYRDVVGLRLVASSDAHAAFDLEGTRLLLVPCDPPTVESLLAFAVDDVSASVARLRAAGVAVRSPPGLREHDAVRGAHVVYFDDPDGRPLAFRLLHEPRHDSAERCRRRAWNDDPKAGDG